MKVNVNILEMMAIVSIVKKIALNPEKLSQQNYVKIVITNNIKKRFKKIMSEKRFCEYCGKPVDLDRNCDLCIDCYDDEWDETLERHEFNNTMKKELEELYNLYCGFIDGIEVCLTEVEKPIIEKIGKKFEKLISKA